MAAITQLQMFGLEVNAQQEQQYIISTKAK